MLESERIAIAAHLHVQLRRVTGRVTDTEWMARNLEYADDVVRFARAAALEKGLDELAELAHRMDTAMQALRPAPKPVKVAPKVMPVEAPSAPAGLEARYVGRLR
ncbi:MAG: hypothetical protein HYX45_07055 [Burkholderiales bacterium]|nr:hypothetical protein [Burkholderiales bacterium]